MASPTGFGHGSKVALQLLSSTPPHQRPASGYPAGSGIQIPSLTANMPLACLPIILELIFSLRSKIRPLRDLNPCRLREREMS